MTRRMIFEVLNIKKACIEGQKNPTWSNRVKRTGQGSCNKKHHNREVGAPSQQPPWPAHG